MNGNMSVNGHDHVVGVSVASDTDTEPKIVDSTTIRSKQSRICSHCNRPWHQGPDWRTCGKRGHLSGAIACKRVMKEQQ